MTTDQTAAIEVLARLLCAADVHVHDGDHPTWQQLRVAQHGRGQDDYRKAARWLLPRMTVATSPAAVPVPPPADRAALRERIRRVLCEASGNGFMWGTDMLEPDEYGEVADAVLAVLPEPTNQAAEAEPPLSPDYEHPECGFHWHGRDGMDIPMRDGQPICPRCELRKVEKQLHYTQRRREEVGAESLRRGKTVLDQSEKIRALEREVDEVRRQLGAEILRAGQAESTLDHFRGIVRRLAAHAVGFQDVLDDSDRDPWAKTVGADIAELRRMAAEEQPAETVPCVRPEPHPAHLHSGLRKGIAVHGRCPGAPAAEDDRP